MLRLTTCLALMLQATAVLAQDDAPEPYGLDSSKMPSEMMPLASQSLLLDITPFTGGYAAVGQRGHILLSTDLENWKQAEVPTRSTLTSVFAVDNMIWAAGHDAVVVHSPDGGQTWHLQYSEPDLFQPLLDVFFTDNKNGFAVGAYGYVLRTSDGGVLWEETTLEIGTGEEPADDELADDDTVADDDGLDDPFGEDDSPNYDFSDFEDEYNDFHLNAMVQLSDGTLYIAGETGNGLVSTDNGDSWEKIKLPYGGSMFGVLTNADDELITFGLRGNAFKSSDMGQSWEQLETGVEDTLIGGVANGDGSVILVGNNGRVLISDPAITQFRTVVVDAAGDIAGLVRRAVNQYVLVGENGIVHNGQ